MGTPGRFAVEVQRLREAVLAPGDPAAELRAAAATRAGELALGEARTPVPEGLAAYVDKVALHAYKVVDRDVEELKEAGYSEDEIFEVTVAAAVGSALERLDAGLRALRAETS